MSRKTAAQIRETAAELFQSFQSYQSNVTLSQGIAGMIYRYQAQFGEQNLSSLVGRMDRFLRAVLTGEELALVHRALFLDFAESSKANLVRRATALIYRATGMLEDMTDDELTAIPANWFLEKQTSTSVTQHNHFHSSVSGGVNAGDSIQVDDSSIRHLGESL